MGKMQDDAEKHTEDDKKKREDAEIRNNIDTGIWSAEQQLNEHKNNITPELQNEINDSVNQVKIARDSGDTSEMKIKNEQLQKALMKIGEVIYSNQKSTEKNKTGDEETLKEEEK